LNVRRGRLGSRRRRGYWKWWDHGINEPLCYGNGQENAERDWGVLLICVCATEKTKGELAVTINASFAGITEIRG